MTNWTEVYKPLLGRRLEAAAWMPVTCDTSGVVANLDQPEIFFSGTALLAFEDAPDVFLTWAQQDDDSFLTAADQSTWKRLALDRIRMSSEGPWTALSDARLERVEVFSSPELGGGRPVGLKHVFATASGPLHLWVGTGRPHEIGDADDLWVGVGVDPRNVAELIPIEVIDR